MKRRQFAVLMAGFLAVPRVAFGQVRGRPARVGILTGRGVPNRPDRDPAFGPFLQRMRELGYVEGSGITYEWRSAEGRYERLAALAAELVAAKVDVILAGTPPAVKAAMRATTTIPIVMYAVGDPVALRFVASLPRPGGNVTGVTNAIDDVSTKYLELLRLAVPKLTRVASLANPDNPNYRNIFAPVAASGRQMGIEVRMVEATTPAQIERAFAEVRRLHAGAVIVQGDGFFSTQGRQIAELALASRVATIAWTRSLVDAGCLMSYGQDVGEDAANAANFVDRILRGAKPRDLPVEQPTNPKLVINGRTTKALGLTLPSELLLRAAEVIQ
jgi:putative ABC transport system substrate-binding protein